MDKVIVCHDWLGDARNYEPMRPYLSFDAFAYELIDLRGYGRSRDRLGRYDLREAADDIRALMGGQRVHLVGHSMSTLIVQQVAADVPEQVASLVLVAPIVPSGMGAPPEVVETLEEMGMSEAMRREVMTAQWGSRLSPRWAEFKLRRWSESAVPEAVRGYGRMFATSTVTTRYSGPVLAIIGEHDTEPFTEPIVREGLTKAYPKLELWRCTNAGHYPMQETPVALASRIEAFLRSVR